MVFFSSISGSIKVMAPHFANLLMHFFFPQDAYKSSCHKTGKPCSRKCDQNITTTCAQNSLSKSIDPLSDVYLEVEGVKWYRPVTLKVSHITIYKNISINSTNIPK